MRKGAPKELLGTVLANCWYRGNWLLGLLTGVDGMARISPVAMAIQANFVDRDKNCRPHEGLFVGLFGWWFLHLTPTEKRSCRSWKRRWIFFFVFAVKRGRANKGISACGL